MATIFAITTLILMVVSYQVGRFVGSYKMMTACQKILNDVFKDQLAEIRRFKRAGDDSTDAWSEGVLKKMKDEVKKNNEQKE